MVLKISIDTCILLDLLLNQNQKSIDTLKNLYDNHDEMVICGLVFGELYPFFERDKKSIDIFLSDMGINIEICTRDDYAYAGKKWNDYCLKRKTICPKCGKSINLKCPNCDNIIQIRQHILSDFII